MAAPYEILKHFNADADELSLVGVCIQEQWHKIVDLKLEAAADLNLLDPTLLVVWFQRGVSAIAVQYEDRVVEFDLKALILRDGLNPVERES